MFHLVTISCTGFTRGPPCVAIFMVQSTVHTHRGFAGCLLHPWYSSRLRVVHLRRNTTHVTLPRYRDPPLLLLASYACFVRFAALADVFAVAAAAVICVRVQGIAPEISRGVLSAALMLMVKEKIHSAVKGAIIGRRATAATK